MAGIHSHKIDEKSYDTVMQEDVKIKGKLTFTKPMMIKCEVEGDIVSESDVFVDTKARISADINAASIRVRGIIKGNLKASDSVELEESARVSGNIEAPRIVMENGSLFDGSSIMPFLDDES